MTQSPYAEEFIATIRKELTERINRNPKYSLRAFSRDIELHPSRVSQILNGKQGLSSVVAKRIAWKMGLNAEESRRFCQLATYLHSRSKNLRDLAYGDLQAGDKSSVNYKLQEDAWEYISRWYHVVIQELCCNKKFVFTAENIAKVLSLSEIEVKDALERMLRLNILKCDKNGAYSPHQEHLHIPGGIPSLAIKNAHEQYMDKAKIALYTQGLEERHFITVVMSLDEKGKNDIKKLLEDISQQVYERSKKSKNKNMIYALGIQFCKTVEI